MNSKRFYDYNSFLRKKFEAKVYKISIDAGFTCPNIDGKVASGGCIYCNNKSFSPAARMEKKSIAQQMREGIEFARRRFKAQKFLAYFQAFTNTYGEPDYLEDLYRQALEFDDVVGIAVGTRPDEIDLARLQVLEHIAQEYFVAIEYGVQTSYNETLRWINRGHTWESFLEAMKISRNRGLHICAHIMLGFPKETKEAMLATAQKVCCSGIDGIKIHNLLIVKNTQLAKIYTQEPFPLFKYHEYLELVCDIIEQIPSHIVIERLFANTTQEYLIAPEWEKSPGAVTDDVTRLLAERESYQGKLYRS